MPNAAAQTFVVVTALVLVALSATAPVAGAVTRGVASWPEAGRGNHRALVHVDGPAPAVNARVEWRRHDLHPEARDIRVFDATTGQRVTNVARGHIDREYGEIAFQPVTAPGDYEVYYLPSDGTSYLPAEDTADPAWREALGEWQSLPPARLLEIQARTDFDRFDPMEIIATEEETADLLAEHADATYLLFPEGRRYPIRMFDDLPQRWIGRGPSSAFRGQARPGEHYTFQIGVWAAGQPVEGLEVRFTDLAAAGGGKPIPASALTCYNLGGIDVRGRPMEREFRVAEGKTRPLWIGVQIPEDAADTHRGLLTIAPEGAPATDVSLTIAVSGGVLRDSGEGELWRMSRLRWLNSRAGVDDDTVTPYTPLEVEANTIRCLGREVVLGDRGLPARIATSFRRSQIEAEVSNELLAGPIEVVAETDGGVPEWSPGVRDLVSATPSVALHKATAECDVLSQLVWTRTEMEGALTARVVLEAKHPVDLKDVSLTVPVARQAAKYMMGLGRRGGPTPGELEWTWDANTNMVWLGDVDAGLDCRLLAADGQPNVWTDADIRKEHDAVYLRAHTGERRLEAGERLTLRFQLLVTPFKPICREHWDWRYEFRVLNPDAEGSTVLHVHHTEPPHPYIGYPFREPELLADWAREYRRAGGLGTNLYYLGHWSLSNRAAELWALRSLGDEVLATGGVDVYWDEVNSTAGGHPWLQEHLVAGYAAGWYGPLVDKPETDMSILINGMSRWHNYCLEGWRWLVENTGVDGIYLDGIPYDRLAMRRVAKVLHETTRNDPYRMQYHNNDCFGENVYPGPLNVFTGVLPYINDLWFGEQFDPDLGPEYWLLEMSGIPFGLTGEMLHNSGNPHRGMLYGMTCRTHPSHPAMWAFWDEFGIQDAEMIGYWIDDCPVTTGRDDVLATVYQRPDRALVSLASWADETVDLSLDIDWLALGLSAAASSLTGPAISHVQEARTFAPGESIPVEPGKGWLLVLSE